MVVGGDPIQLPTDLFDSTNGRGTIIDSGTTLAYLPDSVYEQLMEKVRVILEVKKKIFFPLEFS